MTWCSVKVVYAKTDIVIASRIVAKQTPACGSMRSPRGADAPRDDTPCICFIHLYKALVISAKILHN